MIEYDPKNWVRICFALHGSVAPRLLPRVALAGAIGFGAQWAQQQHGFTIPPLAHTLIGVALGLLLVFRTNASYGRYVEARALLGRALDAARDLGRQLTTLIPEHEGWPQRRAEMLRWVRAFYALVGQSVRGETDLAKLGDRLTTQERERLAGVTERAPVVATWISAHLGKLQELKQIDSSKLRAIDSNLTSLIQALGGCQRIRHTPVPFAYAQHIKIFVVLFVYTVPLAMAEPLGPYTWIAAAILAFALFGIDEIGIEIEDPFGYDPNDLPVDAIGGTIDTSLREMAANAQPS